jgi:hypothetical protein
MGWGPSGQAVSIALIGGRFDGFVLELDEAQAPELMVSYQTSAIPERWSSESYVHAPELEIGDGRVCYRALAGQAPST